jgi:hypothetical protein
MIDISSTVLALSEDSAAQEEVQDVTQCLRTLYLLAVRRETEALALTKVFFLISPWKWQRPCMCGR